MTASQRSDAIELARRLVPHVDIARGAVRRSVKCTLVPCVIEGKPAIVKMLERDEPPWRFYFEREIAIHRAFATHPAPVRVPRLLAADDRVMIFERIGTPIVLQRHEKADDATWRELLDLAPKISAYPIVPCAPPDDASRKEMRARVLEDPSAPRAWVTEGIERLLGRSIEVGTEVRFQHGDLLLRNVLRDGTLAIVDWECAGAHLVGWDDALLWVFAPEWARRELSSRNDASFTPLCVFALLRELHYRKRLSDDAISQRLRADLDTLLALVH